MAMAGNWPRIYNVTHDLTLALRAIERFVIQPRVQATIANLSEQDLQALLHAIPRGELNVVRHKIREAEIRTLDDMPFIALRERASDLRIPCYNKMNRAELLLQIKLIEHKIQEQVAKMLPVKCVVGFIHGDGI